MGVYRLFFFVVVKCVLGSIGFGNKKNQSQVKHLSTNIKRGYSNFFKYLNLKKCKKKYKTNGTKLFCESISI